MNDIQTIISRQIGSTHGSWSCDSVLKRLVVQEGESFLGVGVDGVLSQDPPIFACRFAEAKPYQHLLALANEEGVVAIQDTWKVNKWESVQPVSGFQCHINAVFDLAWMPGDLKLITVSGDHSACLWDVGEGNPRRLMQFVQHTRSVKTAVFPPRNPNLFATGARDGNILLWDVRCPPAAAAPILLTKPDNSLFNCHSPFLPKTPGRKQARLSNNITGLVFQDENNIISSGENDGNIKVWDLRKNYNIYKRDPLPKHSIPYCGNSTKNGYSNLIVDDSGVRLYASGMDSVIYCFNISTYNILPEQRYVGHESGTFYIKTSLSPDGQYLVSGSSDRNAYIWNIKSSEPIVKLVGHTAEVTCAIWCQAGETKIVTCSDDARHKIWRIGKEILAKDEEISLRGRAEIVPRVEASRFAPRNIETTPKSIKRKQQSITPISTKRSRTTYEFTSNKKSKRCLSEMLNATRSDKQDVDGCKKIKCDIPETDVPLENRDPKLSPTKRKCSTERLEGTPVKKCRESRYELAEPGPSWGYNSPKKVGGGDSFITPTKYYERCSPKKFSPKSSRSLLELSSPTANLPNYIMDGEAPHLRLMSPIKRKQESKNWLAAIVSEKKLKLEKPHIVEKVSQSVTPLSPKADNVPVRRNSTNLEKTPKRKQKSTILKYFNKVTNT